MVLGKGRKQLLFTCVHTRTRMHECTHAHTHTLLSPGVFLFDPPPVDLPCLEGVEERQVDHSRPLSGGGRATHLATRDSGRGRGRGRRRGREEEGKGEEHSKHNTVGS